MALWPLRFGRAGGAAERRSGGAARLWVDAIIDPADTHEVVARSLAACANNAHLPEFTTGVLQT